MTKTARSIRLVQALAAAAVTLAAMGAVTAHWRADRRPQPAPAVQAQRPAADEPVEVVKAPPQAENRL